MSGAKDTRKLLSVKTVSVGYEEGVSQRCRPALVHDTAFSHQRSLAARRWTKTSFKRWYLQLYFFLIVFFLAGADEDS